MQKRGKKSADSTLKLKKGPGNNSPSLSNVLRAYLFQRKRRLRQCRRHFGEGSDRQKAIILYSALSMLPCRSIFLPCAFSSLVSLYSETRPLPATAFGRLEEFESFFWRNFLLHVGKPPVFSEMSSLALKIVLHHRRRINQRSSARPPLPKKGGQTNAPPSPVSPLYWPSRKPGGSKSPWTPNSFG